MTTPSELDPKPATEATRLANAQVLRDLPFDDTFDFELIARGLVAPLIDGGLVKGDKGQFIFSYDAYGFADGEAPDTVNPSLWRQATLMGKGGGLFKLADRLYQVIGQDLSNTTIIEGDTGLIIGDTLMSAETAALALELYYQHRQGPGQGNYLHTLPRRPFRRSQRICHRRRDRVRCRKSLCTRQFHGGSDLRERARRRGDDPSRNVHVRIVPAPGSTGAGIRWSRIVHLARHVDVRRADRRHHRAGTRRSHRRCARDVHARTGHRRSPNVVLSTRFQGARVGGGRHAHNAQPVHVARRQNSRRQGLVALRSSGYGTFPRRRNHFRAASLAHVGQRQDLEADVGSGRPVQVSARSDVASCQQGTDTGRDCRPDRGTRRHRKAVGTTAGTTARSVTTSKRSTPSISVGSTAFPLTSILIRRWRTASATSKPSADPMRF